MNIHFWPKTEKAENDEIAHFRHRKLIGHSALKSVCKDTGEPHKLRNAKNLLY